jgi:hypothetical protein
VPGLGGRRFSGSEQEVPLIAGGKVGRTHGPPGCQNRAAVVVHPADPNLLRPLQPCRPSPNPPIAASPCGPECGRPSVRPESRAESESGCCRRGIGYCVAGLRPTSR